MFSHNRRNDVRGDSARCAGAQTERCAVQRTVLSKNGAGGGLGRGERCRRQSGGRKKELLERDELVEM